MSPKLQNSPRQKKLQKIEKTVPVKALTTNIKKNVQL